jgi:hypothetical protein
MSGDAARTTANLILAVAAGAAVYVVLKTPELRRTVWRAIHSTVTVTLPGLLIQEVKGAWAESARRPPTAATAHRS